MRASHDSASHSLRRDVHRTEMKLLVLAVCGAALGACSASSSATTPDASTPSAPEPSATPYPTRDAGWRPRRGDQPGQTIPNLALRGYAARSTTLSTVSFDTFYDPKGTDHDLVVFVVGGRWEPVSATLLRDLDQSPIARVSVVGILVHGSAAGAPATEADLDPWLPGRSRIAALVDPGGAAGFGGAFDLAALPAAVMVDARTMEIVEAATGATDRAAIEREAAAVRARPPAP